MRGVDGQSSVQTALLNAAASLRDAGSDSPRLDAEVLLASVLGVDRAALLAHARDPLDKEARARFEALVARRARGEPVAYLTGRRGWYDLTLRVTPDVLVPRPETEGLLERALAWARTPESRVQAAVDVGTGSGALAIALAHALPHSRVYAIDASSAALAVARENAARAGVPPGRLTFLHGDLLDPLPEMADLVVANLPYIGEEEYAGLARDVRLYEPRLALVGGAHGHELLARLLSAAPARLRPGGALFAELGPPQAEPALDAARAAFPRARVHIEDDYAGLARYLVVET